MSEYTEYVEKKGLVSEYYEVRIHSRSRGKIVAQGVGATEKEARDVAYKDLREKQAEGKA